MLVLVREQLADAQVVLLDRAREGRGLGAPQRPEHVLHHRDEDGVLVAHGGDEVAQRRQDRHLEPLRLVAAAAAAAGPGRRGRQRLLQHAREGQHNARGVLRHVDGVAQRANGRRRVGLDADAVRAGLRDDRDELRQREVGVVLEHPAERLEGAQDLLAVVGGAGHDGALGVVGVEDGAPLALQRGDHLGQQAGHVRLELHRHVLRELLDQLERVRQQRDLVPAVLHQPDHLAQEVPALGAPRLGALVGHRRDRALDERHELRELVEEVGAVCAVALADGAEEGRQNQRQEGQPLVKVDALEDEDQHGHRVVVVGRERLVAQDPHQRLDRLRRDAVAVRRAKVRQRVRRELRVVLRAPVDELPRAHPEHVRVDGAQRAQRPHGLGPDVGRDLLLDDAEQQAHQRRVV